MKKTYWLIIIPVILLILSGCTPTFKAEPHLTIQSHSWLKEQIVNKWWVEITGEAVNDGNVTLTYAEIWAKFYNASNVVITKEYTNNLDLEVGEVWHFLIIYWHDIEPDHYELFIADLSY